MELNLSLPHAPANVLDKHILDILLTSFPFKYLKNNELALILPYCEIINFPQGAVFIEQGQKEDGLFVILKGRALQKSIILGHELIHLDYLKEGDFLCEGGLITQAYSPCHVICQQNLICFKLSNTYFELLGSAFPNIRYKILKGIMEKLFLRLKNSQNEIVKLGAKNINAPPSFISQIQKIFSMSKVPYFESVHLTVDSLFKILFSHYFSEDEYKILISHCELIKTDPNFTLTNQNNDCYIIIRGAVQANINDGGSFIKVAVLSIMNFFTSLSHYDNLLSYTTCERSILLKISSANCEIIEKTNLHVWHKIYNFICISLIFIERATAKLVIRLNSENL